MSGLIWLTGRFQPAVVAVCAFSLPGCATKPTPEASDLQPAVIASTTPPFATKEPERYRAVRTISSTEAGSSRITKTTIARDGVMRREEYEVSPGENLIYLETGRGRFALLPSAKIFTDLDSFSDGSEALSNGSFELSTERLLNQAPVETRYQKVGSDLLYGRRAVKYRVVLDPPTDGTVPASEMLVWVDEDFGMPVRWETTTLDGGQSRTIMELSEINAEVDSGVFQIPANYREVDGRALLTRIRAGRKQNLTEEKR